MILSMEQVREYEHIDTLEIRQNRHLGLGPSEEANLLGPEDGEESNHQQIVV
jgi:hypothetical protein